MGLAIVPNPRTADWNLPIAIPGQPYEVQFSTIGGSGTVTWCLWDFHANPDPCDSCSGDLNELGCLVKDFDPNGDKDCDCYQPSDPDDACTCDCGLLDWMEWDEQTATLSCASVPSNLTAECYQFVVAAKDSSESPYDLRAQRVVRLFRISVGEGYGPTTPPSALGYDTYVSQGEPNSTFCTATTLQVRKAANADKVALLRFDRAQGVVDHKLLGGEIILHAATSLTDATLYYLEDDKCPAWLPTCGSLNWSAWSTFEGNYSLVPVATVWNIQAGDLVRFDISETLKLKRYKCGWDSHPYFEFAIKSNDSNSAGGFYSSEDTDPDHHAPRLAFTHRTYAEGEHSAESAKCNDCSDNDCDGLVDDDDPDCD